MRGQQRAVLSGLAYWQVRARDRFRVRFRVSFRVRVYSKALMSILSLRVEVEILSLR